MRHRKFGKQRDTNKLKYFNKSSSHRLSQKSQKMDDRNKSYKLRKKRKTKKVSNSSIRPTDNTSSIIDGQRQSVKQLKSKKGDPKSPMPQKIFIKSRLRDKKMINNRRKLRKKQSLKTANKEELKNKNRKKTADEQLKGQEKLSSNISTNHSETGRSHRKQFPSSQSQSRSQSRSRSRSRSSSLSSHSKDKKSGKGRRFDDKNLPRGQQTINTAKSVKSITRTDLNSSSDEEEGRKNKNLVNLQKSARLSSATNKTSDRKIFPPISSSGTKPISEESKRHNANTSTRAVTAKNTLSDCSTQKSVPQSFGRKLNSLSFPKLKNKTTGRSSSEKSLKKRKTMNKLGKKKSNKKKEKETEEFETKFTIKFIQS